MSAKYGGGVPGHAMDRAPKWREIELFFFFQKIITLDRILEKR
jgi:hypothetical protein